MANYPKARPVRKIPVVEPEGRLQKSPVSFEFSQCQGMVQIMATKGSMSGYPMHGTYAQLDEATIRAVHEALGDAIKHIDRKRKYDLHEYSKGVSR